MPWSRDPRQHQHSKGIYLVEARKTNPSIFMDQIHPTLCPPLEPNL